MHVDEKKDDCTADQSLCFHYIDSKIPLLSESEISSFGCTTQFVSDIKTGFLTTPLIINKIAQSSFRRQIVLM